MDNHPDTSKELLQELAALRQRVAQLEAMETWHQELEQDLAQERDLLRTLIDNLPDYVFIKDTQSRFLVANVAVAQLMGTTPDELLGKTDFDFYPEALATKYYTDEQKLFQTEEALIDLPENPITPDGKVLWSLTSKIPLRDKNGKVTTYLGVGRDITALKEAEQAQVRERNLLRTLIDTLPDSILCKDADGRLAVANRMAARQLGIDDPEQLVGKTDFDVFPPHLAQQHHADDLAVMQSGQPRLDCEGLTPDRETGEDRWVLTSQIPLRDEQGNVTGLVSIVRDITERKRAEEAREQVLHQEQLIEAQRQAILELSTPIIPVMDRILVMPLVGHIDTLRAKEILRALLRGVSQYRAKIVIVDVTGVPMMDSGVAGHLDKAIQAARLKGARTIVTGLTDTVAEIIVDLGIDWNGIETLRDLQTGLIAALNSLGIRLNV